MEKNKKGFIAISIIYSFFILFITVMLLIMYGYINDRKINSKVKSDLINNLRRKEPDIIVSNYGSILPNPSYTVDVSILDGGNGIASAKYIWSESPNATPNIDLPSYEETLTTPQVDGKYHLIVKACDINLNCKTVITNSFNVATSYVCRRAKTLHTEKCENDTNNQYCLSAGYAHNDTITYGQLGINSVIALGDAYDCDVNADGNYDAINERFYYLSDYYNPTSKTKDTTKATLIYSKNVNNGAGSNTHTTVYNTTGDGPSSLLSDLPITTSWNNVSLFNQTRNITSDNASRINVIYDYTGQVEEFVAPEDGTYLFQLWGASGGKSLCNNNSCGTPGRGGYAEGRLELQKNDKLYIYVGEQGHDAVYQQNSPATFNGGGLGTWDNSDDEAAGSGGGATDVRLVSGSWDDATSLRSRIIVAGGGGGSSWDTTGGSGGGINGTAGSNQNASGGTQTTGYQFGIGQSGSGNGYDSRGSAGAGGGYYGGIIPANTNTGGGGGSGYISGHVGCVAVASADNSEPKSGCNNESNTKACSIHYSEKEFADTSLIPGNGIMPTVDGTSSMTGNVGNGHVKITLVSNTASASQTNFDFAYTGKAARIPSYYELNNCISNKQYSFVDDVNTVNLTTKKTCEFLFENTRFSKSSNSIGYWLENPYTGYPNNIWVVNSQRQYVFGGSIKSNSSDYGVRPVIEVHKSRMEI